jgi:hypothetical protein
MSKKKRLILGLERRFERHDRREHAVVTNKEVGVFKCGMRTAELKTFEKNNLPMQNAPA